MTQKDNSDLYEYGRLGRGVGVGIMLAFSPFSSGGLFWFGTRSSDEISDGRLTPQRQSMGAGTMSGREISGPRPPADIMPPPPAARQ